MAGKKQVLQEENGCHLVEVNGREKTICPTILVSPEKLNIFGSELSIKILREMAYGPICAMDIARNLGEHEQKIYYHINKMKRAGIIELAREEKRSRMTAKLFSLVAPAVSARLV